MDCGKFQDQISDYLDGELESRARAECAAHRLYCRSCREVYSDVRATMTALVAMAANPMPAPVALEERILAATTAGVMLNCGEFDELLERYFDGVILAPTFQTFQGHFEDCSKCRRLLGSIEDAIDLCHEVKSSEVDVPNELCDRIVAATSGRHRLRDAFAWIERIPRRAGQVLRSLWTPQWAAAALIFLSSCTLVTLRFGSVSGLASQAEAQAEKLVTDGHSAINQTGATALIGIQRVSTEVSNFWRDGDSTRRAAKRRPQVKPEPSPYQSANPTRAPETVKKGIERNPHP
ncbi:MAG: zf-HC2 domain-containing protein [Acidobacteriota bacterium]